MDIIKVSSKSVPQKVAGALANLFRESIDEVEALFYLGLCNFKLKNFEKSDIIFNQIKKTYKYSIWDEKIKILLKEI